jgi:hypothetical protein
MCRIDLIAFSVTLRSVMRSTAWRSIRVDMLSTNLCRVGEAEAEEDIAGSDVVVWDDASGGGGGDDDDVVICTGARACTFCGRSGSTCYGESGWSVMCRIDLIDFFCYLEEHDEVCGLEEHQSTYVIDEFVQGWVGRGGGAGSVNMRGCHITQGVTQHSCARARCRSLPIFLLINDDPAAAFSDHAHYS